MRRILAFLSIFVFIAAGAVILFSSLSRKKDVYLTRDLIQDFNPKTVPQAKSQPSLPGPARARAVPAPSLTAPLAGSLELSEEMKAKPRAAPVLPADSWVPGNQLYQAFMADPVRFIAQKTLLGRPAQLIAFARDPARVDRYLNHPLIRGVLDSPMLTRAVAGRPTVLQGFLASPAMQNSAAVSALAKSQLLKELGRKRGVQAMMEDSVFVSGVLMNPKAVDWMARHPDAAKAFQSIGKSPKRK